jgi:hypothetical protein
MSRPTKIRFFTRNKRDFVRDDFEKYIKKHQIKYRPPIQGAMKVEIADLVEFDTHAFRNHQLKDKSFTKTKGATSNESKVEKTKTNTKKR